MNLELTKEEIEAINIDVAHILDKITLPESAKEIRRSLLSKLKPEPTREEITQNWVKDNNIEVGSKVKVAMIFEGGDFKYFSNMDNFIGKTGTVIEILDSYIVLEFPESLMLPFLRCSFMVESLMPYKPQPTREEITAQWVKDNKIEVGSKVKIIRPSSIIFEWSREKDRTIGNILRVKYIMSDRIILEIDKDVLGRGCAYDVESLEPYKEEYIHFTFEDREMFRDKWIRLKGAKNESRINFISSDSSVSCASWTQTESLSDLFKTHEFVDGTPFGKIKE
jgi:uncharacterized membrane protein (UPF0127 family)